jgi:hypothetical protein
MSVAKDRPARSWRPWVWASVSMCLMSLSLGLLSWKFVRGGGEPYDISVAGIGLGGLSVMLSLVMLFAAFLSGRNRLRRSLFHLVLCAAAVLAYAWHVKLVAQMHVNHEQMIKQVQSIRAERARHLPSPSTSPTAQP